MNQKQIKEISSLIPVTWLDPLLSGKNALIGEPPYNCKDIEKLLLGIKKRIETTKIA